MTLSAAAKRLANQPPIPTSPYSRSLPPQCADKRLRHVPSALLTSPFPTRGTRTQRSQHAARSRRARTRATANGGIGVVLLVLFLLLTFLLVLLLVLLPRGTE